MFSLGPLPTDCKTDQDEYEVTGRAWRVPVTVWKERTSLGSSALCRRWELRFGLEKGSGRIIVLKGDPVQLSLAPVYFLKQTPGAQATPATTGTLTMISPSPPYSMYEDQPKCFMQTPSTFPFEWNKSLLIKTRLVSYGSSMLLCTVHMRSFLIGIFKSFTRITVTDFNVTNSTKRESVLPWSNGRHKL